MIQINQSISGSSEKQSPNQWLFKTKAENTTEIIKTRNSERDQIKTRLNKRKRRKDKHQSTKHVI